MHITQSGLSAAPDAIAFALAERRQCLSEREWQHRLRGYGYTVRDTPAGRMLVTVTGGREIGALDG